MKYETVETLYCPRMPLFFYEQVLKTIEHNTI